MRDRLVKFEVLTKDSPPFENWVRESLIRSIFFGPGEAGAQVVVEGGNVPVTTESATAAIEFINECSTPLERISENLSRIEDHLNSIVSDTGHLRIHTD